MYFIKIVMFNSKWKFKYPCKDSVGKLVDRIWIAESLEETEEFGSTVRRVVKVLKSCACPWKFNKFYEFRREDLIRAICPGTFESIGPCAATVICAIYRVSGCIGVA